MGGPKKDCKQRTPPPPSDFLFAIDAKGYKAYREGRYLAEASARGYQLIGSLYYLRNASAAFSNKNRHCQIRMPWSTPLHPAAVAHDTEAPPQYFDAALTFSAAGAGPRRGDAGANGRPSSRDHVVTIS